MTSPRQVPVFRKFKDTEYLVTRTPSVQGVRDLKGQFLGLNQKMKKAFEEAAIILQQYEAEYLRRTRLRPQGAKAGRPEEYLLKALVSPHNRRVTQDGLAVNLVEWLDSAESKVNLYWRGLEDGTSKHVGQKIFGFFVGSDGRAYGPESDRRTDRLFVSSRENGIAGAGVAKKHAKKAEQTLKFFRIRNRIEPVHYITNGLRAWESAGILQKSVDKVFQSAGLPVRKI